MHNFLHYCFKSIIFSSTGFGHPSFHPQEDLYMQFYGISFSIKHILPTTRQPIWMHERNTIRVQVQILMFC